LPVAGFLRDALAAGYSGPLSLEVFNDEFRTAPARRIARDALRSLVWLEDQAGVAPLPALPRLGAVDFIEFAVDGQAHDALARFIAPLGFPPRRHAPFEGGRAVAQRRCQHRAECRTRQRGIRTLRNGRPLRLRHGVPGG
jgi:4-hydroxyphenylpyruvate dioxygenase